MYIFLLLHPKILSKLMKWAGTLSRSIKILVFSILFVLHHPAAPWATQLEAFFTWKMPTESSRRVLQEFGTFHNLDSSMQFRMIRVELRHILKLIKEHDELLLQEIIKGSDLSVMDLLKMASKRPGAGNSPRQDVVNEFGQWFATHYGEHFHFKSMDDVYLNPMYRAMVDKIMNIMVQADAIEGVVKFTTGAQDFSHAMEVIRAMLELGGFIVS